MHVHCFREIYIAISLKVHEIVIANHIQHHYNTKTMQSVADLPMRGPYAFFISGGFTNEGALRVFQNMGPYFMINFLDDVNMYFLFSRSE